MKKTVAIIIALVLLAGLLVVIGISRKGQARKSLEIAVIPKGTTHSFWKSIHAGALKAAKEDNVQILWNGPEREGNRQRQIEIVEDFIARKVDGVVLAPIDSEALVPSVEKLSLDNIPCVIIDSGINIEKYVSFVATDNYKGGVLAARRMGKILEGKGNVIVVKYAPGSSSTTARENGFIETIQKEFPQIKIIDTKYGMDTVETAIQAAEDLLTKHNDVDGIFACNESTSRGTLRALENQGRVEKIKMVGFDAEELLLQAVRQGHIDSLVIQNPYKIGYEGVKTLIKHIKGQDVPKRIDTGVTLITKDNIDSEEVQSLIK